MNAQVKNSDKQPGGRSKVIDHSKWVSDLKPLRVMVNDELPSEQINFTDQEVLDKVVKRFRDAGHSKDGNTN